MMSSIFIGFVFAVLVSAVAFKLRSLDLTGAISATLLGTIIFGVGGWQWAIILLIFFITSSALSKAFKKKKVGLDEKFSKGSKRDWAQVFGNGGLAGLAALLHGFYPDSGLIWLLFVASLAAVNADTWATEIGVLSPSQPRHILNLSKRVEKGTSGGISWVGSFGSLAGAFVVALPGALLSPYGHDWLTFTLLITFTGFSGGIFDSLLGATAQAIYYCPVCEKETEKHPFHICGTATNQIRGFFWLNNDLVNFGCSLFSVLAAWFLVGL